MACNIGVPQYRPAYHIPRLHIEKLLTISGNFPSVQNHMYIPDGMLHDTVAPDALQKAFQKEGNKPLQFSNEIC